MSHKATNWLSGIPAGDLGHSEFRVLFHLCDCHNPSAGCFPTQAYLIDACGVSNGTLNNALKSLEGKGLIKRHRSYDGKTKRQKPTRYMLGFEIKAPQEPTPEIGDGFRGRKSAKPTPKIGDGADSNLDHDPTPTETTTRLQPTGEVTCKEPVNNLGAGSKSAFFTADERSEAAEVVAHIRGGGKVNPKHVKARVRQCIVSENMADAAIFAALGLG